MNRAGFVFVTRNDHRVWQHASPQGRCRPLTILRDLHDRKRHMIARFLTDRRRFFAAKLWWGFLACLSLEKYVVSLIAGYTWVCFFGSPNPSRVGMVYAPTLAQLADKILWAPFYETILFQFLIIEAARRLKWPDTWQLAASITVFAVAHFIGGGIAHGLLSGVLGGYYLAFTYLAFRERSLFWAMGMTWAFHALNNGSTAMEWFLRYG